MSVKYLWCPHKVICLQKGGDVLTTQMLHVRRKDLHVDSHWWILPSPKHRTKPDESVEKPCKGTKSSASEVGCHRNGQLRRRDRLLRGQGDTRETSSSRDSGRGCNGREEVPVQITHTSTLYPETGRWTRVLTQVLVTLFILSDTFQHVTGFLYLLLL